MGFHFEKSSYLFNIKEVLIMLLVNAASILLTIKNWNDEDIRYTMKLPWDW